MEPEGDLGPPLRPARVRRAVALMAVSVLAIGVATIAYAHPRLSLGFAKPPAASKAEVAAYTLSSVDFVDPSTGWVVAVLPSSDFAVLHTTNAGRTWTVQLKSPGGDAGEYARFFDGRHGVLILLGPQSVLFQTSDGGKTWSRRVVEQRGGHVVSAEFVDALHGWLLIQLVPEFGKTPVETLYRTSDGGVTWVELGDPVLAEDWAYRVVFADSMHGWLYSRSSAAYAYTSEDGGATWRRLSLPAPRGGWPAAPTGAMSTEQFFVAVRPTAGPGVVAVVVPFAPLQGRSSDGTVLVGYPPLTVRSFDGGGSIIYQYRTLADAGAYRTWTSSIRTNTASGPGFLVPDADQVALSSADGGSSWKVASVPGFGGAVGFAGALDWWWVAAGAWATTSDGGVTWTQVRGLPVPEPLPGTLQVLDADHAWYAGMGGTGPFLEKTDDGGHEWSAVRLPAIAGLT